MAKDTLDKVTEELKVLKEKSKKIQERIHTLQEKKEQLQRAALFQRMKQVEPDFDSAMRMLETLALQKEKSSTVQTGGGCTAWQSKTE